jgi:hypothetical protein
MTGNGACSRARSAISPCSGPAVLDCNTHLCQTLRSRGLAGSRGVWPAKSAVGANSHRSGHERTFVGQARFDNCADFVARWRPARLNSALACASGWYRSVARVRSREQNSALACASGWYRSAARVWSREQLTGSAVACGPSDSKAAGTTSSTCFQNGKKMGRNGTFSKGPGPISQHSPTKCFGDRRLSGYRHKLLINW